MRLALMIFLRMVARRTACHNLLKAINKNNNNNKKIRKTWCIFALMLLEVLFTQD